MRGFLFGLIAVGLCLAACGGAKESEFDEDPAAGESGQGGSSATGGSGGSTGGGANAGKGGGSVCDPGTTQMCLGPGACEGAQRCATDGQTWEDCDCGSTGTGGTDTGGTGGGTSGTGGSTGGGGSDGGGGSTGGAGSSGMGGSMGGAGSSGMAQCATDLCPAYCQESTGHCADDLTFSECASWCANDRCVAYKNCIGEHNDYLRCVATGTPVCVSDTSLPSDVDCHAEGAALFDCLDLPWHCDEADGACVCARAEGAFVGEPVCTQTYECCLIDAAGVTCGCGDQAFCDAVGPGFAPIDHCPL